MRRTRYMATLCILLALSLLLASCSPTYQTASGYAMGTLVSVSAQSEKSAAALCTLVNTLEGEISHKISGSAVCAINKGESVPLSAALYSALALSADVEEKTDGAFSIKLLPLTSLWDFEKGIVPSNADIAAALVQIESSKLVLSDGKASLSSGGLDLGAVGKGMAADMLIAALRDTGETGMVAVGGSIGVLGNKNGESWRIGVRDPFSSSQNDTIGTLFLSDSFVSTSGSYEKTFEGDGVIYHHILDPKTGMPVENDLVSVTVVAESGVLSDILSTAAFSVGVDKGAELCKAYGAHALFIKKDGSLWVTEGMDALFTAKEEVNLLEK